MARKGKVKEFFKNYGELFQSFYEDLAVGAHEEDLEYIEHFIAWVGTAALTIGTMTAISAGAALPAVLLGLGTAALATDESVHLIKKTPSIIVSSITKIVSAVLAPPLLAIGYPIVVAGAAISNAIKEGREARQERREARKEALSTVDYAREYDKSVSYEETTIEQPSAPEVVAAELEPIPTPSEATDKEVETELAVDSPDNDGMDTI